MSYRAKNRVFGAILATGMVIAGSPVLAAEQAAKLFAIVTAKDEIVVALTTEDAALEGDAAAIGNAFKERGSLTVWRYAVRKAKDGELEQAPLARINIQANEILRVEPYRTPLRVVAPN